HRTTTNRREENVPKGGRDDYGTARTMLGKTTEKQALRNHSMVTRMVASTTLGSSAFLAVQKTSLCLPDHILQVNRFSMRSLDLGSLDPTRPAGPESLICSEM